MNKPSDRAIAQALSLDAADEIARLREELAYLRARVKKAPVATCDADEWFLGGSTDELLSNLDGKRVRLVVEEE